jgi:hypothetical protein
VPQTGEPNCVELINFTDKLVEIRLDLQNTASLVQKIGLKRNGEVKNKIGLSYTAAPTILIPS